MWETYKPLWWCSNPWLNVFATMIKHRICSLFWPMSMKRENIIAADGGLVSIDWADDPATRSLPSTAPILAILHPLTGDSIKHADFMECASRHGWRSCVMNRRGHSGMSLTTPNFCIMGKVDDTVAMVSHIRERYPGCFLGLAGVSAGSGQVVSFIGREGENANIDAATSLCPAWDLQQAFDNFQKHHSYLDYYLTQGLKSYFVNTPENRPLLEKYSQSAFDKVNKTSSIGEFMKSAYPYAGCDSEEQFFAENNPMNFVFGNTTPCLVLNAEDDFLCMKENIRTDLADSIQHFVLVVTKYGSHIAYNEIGGTNYMWRVTLDFFENVRLEKEIGNF